MKSVSKKLLVLAIIFTVLMAICMPTIVRANGTATATATSTSTATGAEIQISDFQKVGTTTEEVSEDTNMQEYINAKKDAFMEVLEDLGIDLDEEDLDELFVAEGGTYKYIKADKDTAIGADGKFNYTEVIVSMATITTIDTLNVNVKSPIIGDTATETTKPSITLEDDANCIVEYSAYITAYPSEMEEGYDEPFVGTFESGKDYYVEVSLMAKEGYVFTDNDNMALTVNGKTTNYEMNYWNADGSPYYMFYVKVSATTEEEAVAEEENTYEYIEGANQTYVVGNGESARFRIDADYSLFEDGGAVYVDDELVDEDNYTSKSGSTVIELNEDYVSTLDAGEHTLKVAFNNGESATTTFTVEKEESTSTKAPKTGDTVIIWVALIAASILGIALTIKFSKKNK